MVGWIAVLLRERLAFRTVTWTLLLTSVLIAYVASENCRGLGKDGRLQTAIFLLSNDGKFEMKTINQVSSILYH